MGRDGRAGRGHRQPLSAAAAATFHPSVAARLFTAEAKLATDEPAWRWENTSLAPCLHIRPCNHRLSVVTANGE